MSFTSFGTPNSCDFDLNSIRRDFSAPQWHPGQPTPKSSRITLRKSNFPNVKHWEKRQNNAVQLSVIKVYHADSSDSDSESNDNEGATKQESGVLAFLEDEHGKAIDHREKKRPSLAAPSTSRSTRLTVASAGTSQNPANGISIPMTAIDSAGAGFNIAQEVFARLNGGEIGQGSIDVIATKVAPSVCLWIVNTIFLVLVLFHAYTTSDCFACCAVITYNMHPFIL